MSKSAISRSSKSFIPFSEQSPQISAAVGSVELISAPVSSKSSLPFTRSLRHVFCGLDFIGEEMQTLFPTAMYPWPLYGLTIIVLEEMTEHFEGVNCRGASALEMRVCETWTIEFIFSACELLESNRAPHLSERLLVIRVADSTDWDSTRCFFEGANTLTLVLELFLLPTVEGWEDEFWDCLGCMMLLEIVVGCIIGPVEIWDENKWPIAVLKTMWKSSKAQLELPSGVGGGIGGGIGVGGRDGCGGEGGEKTPLAAEW